MKKLIVIFCASISLLGCEMLGTTAIQNTIPYNYNIQTKEIGDPPINEIRKISIGETMLSQLLIKNSISLILTKAITLGNYNISPGIYEKVGEGETGIFFSNAPTSLDTGKTMTNNMIAPGNDGKPVQGLFVPRVAGNQLCIATSSGNDSCAENVSYEIRKVPIIYPKPLQQHLIYHGKNGNKIKVGYREYLDGVARTAFNENIEYALLESDIIVYKNAKIKILKVSAQDIQYRVLNNFNDAVN